VAIIKINHSVSWEQGVEEQKSGMQEQFK
jgi:hypothetical protein